MKNHGERKSGTRNPQYRLTEDEATALGSYFSAKDSITIPPASYSFFLMPHQMQRLFPEREWDVKDLGKIHLSRPGTCLKIGSDNPEDNPRDWWLLLKDFLDEWNNMSED